jgi:anti-sigma regulatory factor (Ser/Thr protein kinase)
MLPGLKPRLAVPVHLDRDDCFRAAATLGWLPDIRKRIVRFYERCGVAPELLDQIHLAAGEAVTNAIHHGCRNDSRRTIEIRCIASNIALVVVVRDPGPGFDPDALPASDLSELDSGGTGILLMRRVMDAVEYSFGAEGTTVRLVKHRLDDV